MWSGVYGTTSTLQHAAQLQLLSQQQILRQHELLMIQQHTAQVLELQRNAQIAVSGLCAVKHLHVNKQLKDISMNITHCTIQLYVDIKA